MVIACFTMREFAYVTLAFTSVIAYFVLAVQFGLYQRWPVVHLALCLAACLGLALLLKESASTARRIVRILALALCLALTGFYAWYTLSYSSYNSTTPDVAVGEDLAPRLGEIRLASHTGEEMPVWAPGEHRGTLYVFYRGFW